MFGWLTGFFKKKPKEEEVCEHCGIALKYHAWTDCLQTRAAIRTASEPASGRAKEFYEEIAQRQRARVGAQTLSEFRENPPQFPVELCGCGCGKSLEMNDPLGPHWMKIEGKKVLVNEDCYFEKFGDFIDEHPIGGPGTHGPKNIGPIE